MHRWGVLITAFYVLVLILLFGPVWFSLAEGRLPTGIEIMETAEHLFDADEFVAGDWYMWVFVGVLLTAQALLLFVSVDTSRKRLRPRRRVAISVGAITGAVGALTFASFLSLLMVSPDNFSDFFSDEWIFFVSPVAFWLIWGIVFYAYREKVSARLDRAVNWLIAGSVLELLIVVPCHIIVRQRHDCSAPGITAYGIATGIAVMLMAFGPSVFFLYQKRLRTYENTNSRNGH